MLPALVLIVQDSRFFVQRDNVRIGGFIFQNTAGREVSHMDVIFRASRQKALSRCAVTNQGQPVCDPQLIQFIVGFVGALIIEASQQSLRIGERIGYTQGFCESAMVTQKSIVSRNLFNQRCFTGEADHLKAVTPGRVGHNILLIPVVIRDDLIINRLMAGANAQHLTWPVHVNPVQEVSVGLKGNAPVIGVIVLFAAAVEQHAVRRLFIKNTQERAFIIRLKLAHMIFIACCDHCIILRESGKSDKAVRPGFSVLSTNIELY